MCWICNHFSYDKASYLPGTLRVPTHHPYPQKESTSSPEITPIVTQMEHLCMVVGEQLLLLLLCFLLCFLPLLFAARSEEEWIPTGTVIKYKPMKNYLDLFLFTSTSPRAVVENKVNAENGITGSTFWNILKRDANIKGQHYLAPLFSFFKLCDFGIIIRYF